MKSVMMIASVGILAMSAPAFADAGQQQTRAQDYNSSRSNTTSAAGPAGDVNTDRDGDNGTRAQDYNSSRSNNSSSVVAPDCANHNTTRANRTAPALDADNDGDGIDNDCDSSPD